MKRLRFVCGLLAILCMLAGLNLLVLTQQPFSVPVMAALGVGLLTGVLWAGMTAWSLMRYSVAEGRAAYTAVSVVNSILFLGICIVAYALMEHNGRTWDLTKEGRRKLADQTVQVLQVLNKDVDVIGFFLQVDDELVRIAQDKTERFLEQCQEYTPHLKVQFLDPQIERTQLEAMHITHASPQGTIVIKCGTRQRVITLQGGSPRLEEKDFTNGLINVMRDTQPRICFLSGHGERNIEDPDETKGGSALKVLLEGESYKAERIGIQIARPEVPADCDVLVVNGLGLSGPQGDLHPEEIKALQAYLDRGGRMLFLLDPWRRTAPAGSTDQLIPWLAQRYGIIVGDDIAVSPTTKFSMEFSGDISRFHDKDPNSGFVGSFNAGHPITQNFDQKLLFTVVRTVDLAQKMPDKVLGEKLLRSTPDFFAENDLATLLASGRANRGPDEKEGPLPVAVAVSAKTTMQLGDSGQTRDARIVVVGDSDFASNEQLSAAAVPGNLNFMLNAIAWLTENEELIAIRPTGKQDPAIMLSDSDQRTIVWIAALGTVQIVTAAGLLALWMRRKHQ